jgi:hypothetical protein
LSLRGGTMPEHGRCFWGKSGGNFFVIVGARSVSIVGCLAPFGIVVAVIAARPIKRPL